jgi:hypothetical protein
LNHIYHCNCNELRPQDRKFWAGRTFTHCCFSHNKFVKFVRMFRKYKVIDDKTYALFIMLLAFILHNFNIIDHVSMQNIWM